MRYKAVFSILFSMFCATANANWTKINNVDYTWGPFNIYNITLFTETGSYTQGIRPLMLTLQYKKPWEGRDFAVSLARTWKNLGIELPENEVDRVVNNLRKSFPDIKPEDKVHYIALEDRGYFILNDRVVSEVYNKAFNDAIVAIWLDPKMDISRQLLDPSYKRPEPVEPAKEEVKPAENTTASPDLVNAKPETHTAETTALNQEEKALAPQVAEKADEKKASESQAEEKKLEEKKPEEKQANEKKEIKKEEKPKAPEIQNPELFISPIFDDLLMLAKPYC